MHVLIVSKITDVLILPSNLVPCMLIETLTALQTEGIQICKNVGYNVLDKFVARHAKALAGSLAGDMSRLGWSTALFEYFIHK